MSESGIKIWAAAGFSFGATYTSAKRAEAEASIRTNADENDMVMNIGAMHSGDLEVIRSDIHGVAGIGHDSGVASQW